MAKPKPINAEVPIKHEFDVWRDSKDGRWHSKDCLIYDYSGVSVI